MTLYTFYRGSSSLVWDTQKKIVEKVSKKYIKYNRFDNLFSLS